MPPHISPSLREAVEAAAKIMYKVHEEETKPFEIEMTWLCEESGMEHQKVWISPEDHCTVNMMFLTHLDGQHADLTTDVPPPTFRPPSAQVPADVLAAAEAKAKAALQDDDMWV